MCPRKTFISLIAYMHDQYKLIWFDLFDLKLIFQCYNLEVNNLPWKGERGPSWVRRTLELFQRQRRENSERRDEAHMGFSARIITILNWTELEGLEVQHTGTGSPATEGIVDRCL